MNCRSQSGFTLIELMVVVIIIAALAAMVVPRIIPASNEAKSYISKGDIANITLALKLYRLHNDKYPSTDEGLKALMSKPSSARNWHGPYLDNAPLDPWRREYQYRYPGTERPQGFDLWSLGAAEETSDDDVSNWEQ